METFSVKDPEYKTKVIESFNLQTVMKTIDASLSKVEPGKVCIELKYNPQLCQQDGYIHAGILSTVIDSACGYAALSLMPPDAKVLTIEFKVNFLAPAKGEIFRASGIVRKPGKTITVTEGELIAINSSKEKLVATMSATMMCLTDRSKTTKLKSGDTNQAT